MKAIFLPITWSDDPKPVRGHVGETVAVFRRRSSRYHLPLVCGSCDDVSFFRDRDHIRCISVNERIGYVGLQTFYMDSSSACRGCTCRPCVMGSAVHFDVDSHEDIFLQSEDDLRAVLGSRWCQLSHRGLLHRLLEHVS